jgi:tetratricopeptide (TPR) repeat protein
MIEDPAPLLEQARQAHLEGQHELAIGLYRRILRGHPGNSEVRLHLGVAMRESGQLTAALGQFDSVLRINPNRPMVWLNRGITLEALGRLAEALGSFDRVIALMPDRDAGYFSRAGILYRMGRFAESLTVFERLAKRSPNDPRLAVNHGVALQWCGQPDKALEQYDRAIALAPGEVSAWLNKAMLLLLLGDLRQGLPLFEWRRRDPNQPAPKRSFERPLWLGETSIAGKTVLLHCEQGYGDMIQFCRYAALAADAGARVILAVQPPLVDLLATTPGASLALSENDPFPNHDLHCPILSLPLAFGTTAETIPAGVPYLYADPRAAAAWRDRISGLPGLRVGLVWAGGSRIGNADMLAIDQRRSLPLAALTPLARVAGCTFFSLQLGAASRQAAQPPAGMVLHDHTDSLRTFADTAAMIETLDLIISVDTAPAHLAGAMGKPVWLLNRFDTDWRWMLNRDDSPWYPTMRLFRQPSPGDWNSVVKAVAEALRTLAGGRE